MAPAGAATAAPSPRVIAVAMAMIWMSCRQVGRKIKTVHRSDRRKEARFQRERATARRKSVYGNGGGSADKETMAVLFPHHLQAILMMNGPEIQAVNVFGSIKASK